MGFVAAKEKVGVGSEEPETVLPETLEPERTEAPEEVGADAAEAAVVVKAEEAAALDEAMS